MSKGFVRCAILSACLACLPRVAVAQGGGIAGVVRDTTGAVLPGVTVEASSPALIEKVRTVVTDDQGRYNVVDLRPGTYRVTFTLPGFTTVQREGIELSVGFTAPVNVELRVGTLEETITVSGESPMIDTQSVVNQKVITRDVIDALPTPKSWQALGQLIPGMTGASDVGGSFGGQGSTMRIHGGNPSDQVVQIDGLAFGVPRNGFSNASATMNDASTEEVVYETGAISAETPGGGGGVRVNIIPKEGGNDLHGSAFGNFASRGMQGDNYSEDLQKQGLRAPDTIDTVWDQSAALGGPFKRDRLWFFGAQRYWGANIHKADTFFAKDPLAFVYEPDTSAAPRRTRTGTLRTVPIHEFPSISLNLRLTWQATQKHKIALFYNRHFRHQDNFQISRTNTTDAATSEQHRHVRMASVTYTAPITNKLLVEAGGMSMKTRFRSWPNSPTAALPTTLSARELSTGVVFRSRPTIGYRHDDTLSARGAVTYVTGSHAAKVGFTLLRGTGGMDFTAHGDVNLILLNGVPNSVTLWATPYDLVNELPADLGLYAQDKWTLRRLTLNLAVRYDHNKQRVPAQNLSGGTWVGPRSFASVEDASKWHDIGPRVGVAYDLFGTGKTALKATLSRYVRVDGTSTADKLNPINTSVNSTTATWNDLNGDFVPQANELGPLANRNFGRVVPTTTYSPDLLSGWFARLNNWEFTASVQHELAPRLSAEVGYFRRSWGNHEMTDNLAVTPADFDPFCITAPVDARLPGGGGNQICGLYDVKPSKFGQVNNLVQHTDNFGKATQVYDGVDVSMSARLGGRAFAGGGVSTGREKGSFCSAVDNPGEFAVPGFSTTRFCEIAPPWQPNVRVHGGYALPWGMQVSGTLQSLPGPVITATQAVRNAEIAPSLGRNLAAGARATYRVDLIQPGTRYGERLYQVDLRLSKRVRVAATQLELIADLYNALNANPVLALNTTYGPDWLKPSGTLQARFVKVGAQLTF